MFIIETVRAMVGSRRGSYGKARGISRQLSFRRRWKLRFRRMRTAARKLFNELILTPLRRAARRARARARVNRDIDRDRDRVPAPVDQPPMADMAENFNEYASAALNNDIMRVADKMVDVMSQADQRKDNQAEPSVNVPKPDNAQTSMPSGINEPRSASSTSSNQATNVMDNNEMASKQPDSEEVPVDIQEPRSSPSSSSNQTPTVVEINEMASMQPDSSAENSPTISNIQQQIQVDVQIHVPWSSRVHSPDETLTVVHSDSSTNASNSPNQQQIQVYVDEPRPSIVRSNDNLEEIIAVSDENTGSRNYRKEPRPSSLKSVIRRRCGRDISLPDKKWELKQPSKSLDPIDEQPCAITPATSGIGVDLSFGYNFQQFRHRQDPKSDDTTSSGYGDSQSSVNLPLDVTKYPVSADPSYIVDAPPNVVRPNTADGGQLIVEPSISSLAASQSAHEPLNANLPDSPTNSDRSYSVDASPNDPQTSGIGIVRPNTADGGITIAELSIAFAALQSSRETRSAYSSDSPGNSDPPYSVDASPNVPPSSGFATSMNIIRPNTADEGVPISEPSTSAFAANEPLNAYSSGSPDPYDDISSSAAASCCIDIAGSVDALISAGTLRSLGALSSPDALNILGQLNEPLNSLDTLSSSTRGSVSSEPAYTIEALPTIQSSTSAIASASATHPSRSIVEASEEASGGVIDQSTDSQLPPISFDGPHSMHQPQATYKLSKSSRRKKKKNRKHKNSI